MISQNLSYTGSYNPYDLIQQAGKKRMNKRKSKKSNKSKKSRKSKKTRKYKK